MKICHLMISNAKETSRNLQEFPPSCLYVFLDYYYVLNVFLIGYLKMTSFPFYFTFIWLWLTWIAFLCLFSISISSFVNVLFLQKRVFWAGFVHSSFAVLPQQTGAEAQLGHRGWPGPTPGIQTILEKQYLLLWLMKDGNNLHRNYSLTNGFLAACEVKTEEVPLHLYITQEPVVEGVLLLIPLGLPPSWRWVTWTLERDIFFSS